MSRPPRFLRRLALVSALLLPLSACSGHVLEHDNRDHRPRNNRIRPADLGTDRRRRTNAGRFADHRDHLRGHGLPRPGHVPQDADPATALPLVLNLHGSESNATLQAEFSGLAAVSPRPTRPDSSSLVPTAPSPWTPRARFPTAIESSSAPSPTAGTPGPARAGSLPRAGPPRRRSTPPSSCGASSRSTHVTEHSQN